jgi:hypothetical protein
LENIRQKAMYKLQLTGPWTDGIGIGEGRKVSHYHATGSLSANPQGDMLTVITTASRLTSTKNKGPEKVKQLT